jgi:hypothetical protein
MEASPERASPAGAARKDGEAAEQPQPQQQGGANGASSGGAAAPGAAAPGAAAPGAAAAVRCFSEVTPSDGRLDFQIIDLGRQVYVWVAAGGAKLRNLSFAIAAPAAGGAPAAAALLRGHASAGADGLAQRLGERWRHGVWQRAGPVVG